MRGVSMVEIDETIGLENDLSSGLEGTVRATNFISDLLEDKRESVGLDVTAGRIWSDKTAGETSKLGIFIHPLLTV